MIFHLLAVCLKFIQLVECSWNIIVTSGIVCLHFDQKQWFPTLILYSSARNSFKHCLDYLPRIRKNSRNWLKKLKDSVMTVKWIFGTVLAMHREQPVTTIGIDKASRTAINILSI